MKPRIITSNYLNGQKRHETPYVNGQVHGIEKWWSDDGSLRYLGKWHQGRRVWGMRFSLEEQNPTDSEIELCFV